MSEVKAVFYGGYSKNEEYIKELSDRIVFVDVEKTDYNPFGRQAQTWNDEGIVEANPGDLILIIDKEVKFIKRDVIYPEQPGEISSVTKFVNKTTGEVVDAIQYLPDGNHKYRKELHKLIDTISYTVTEQDELLLHTCMPVGRRSVIIKDSRGFVFSIAVIDEFNSIYELLNKD